MGYAGRNFRLVCFFSEPRGATNPTTVVDRLEEGFTPHRRYLLERVGGELVFRQPEADAIVEDAINELCGVQRPTSRRVIKLP